MLNIFISTSGVRWECAHSLCVLILTALSPHSSRSFSASSVPVVVCHFDLLICCLLIFVALSISMFVSRLLTRDLFMSLLFPLAVPFIESSSSFAYRNHLRSPFIMTYRVTT